MCLGQTRGVDGQENIGRAVAALVFDALQQFVFLALDAINLDAGLLGKVGVERFVCLVMSCRIKIQDFFFCLSRVDQGEKCGGNQ